MDVQADVGHVVEMFAGNTPAVVQAQLLVISGYHIYKGRHQAIRSFVVGNSYVGITPGLPVARR